MKLSQKEKTMIDIITYLAHLRQDEWEVFDNNENSFNEIYSRLRNQGFRTDTENDRSVMELKFIDIKIGKRVYLFYSKYGIDTWQMAIIFSGLYALNKTPDFNDKILLLSLLQNIGTYIISYFLFIFRGENDTQSLRLPADFPDFEIVNRRVREKIGDRGILSEEEIFSILKTHEILTNTIKLSFHTNEGKKIKFRALFYQDRSETPIVHILDLYKLHFPKNLFRSNKSILSIDRDGYVFSFKMLQSIEPTPFGANLHDKIPFAYQDIANFINSECTSNPGEAIIGITLEEDGTIFIVLISGILCYYRNNQWHFSIDRIIPKIISNVSCDSIIQTIYDSLIFHNGCCLGLLENDNKLFPQDDSDNIFQKLKIVGRRFYEIPAEIRSEVVSIDGATLLEKESLTVRGIAQILPIEASHNEGARTGAAKHIARNNGIGIKVSEDGYIDIYANNNTNAECLFSFGKEVIFNL